MAAHKHGVGFKTEESDTCISLFDGRLRFEGDGSSYSGFENRIGTAGGHVAFPPLTPPAPVNSVKTVYDSPPV